MPLSTLRLLGATMAPIFVGSFFYSRPTVEVRLGLRLRAQPGVIAARQTNLQNYGLNHLDQMLKLFNLRSLLVSGSRQNVHAGKTNHTLS
jgi:hypothetical protein